PRGGESTPRGSPGGCAARFWGLVRWRGWFEGGAGLMEGLVGWRDRGRSLPRRVAAGPPPPAAAFAAVLGLGAPVGGPFRTGGGSGDRVEGALCSRNCSVWDWAAVVDVAYACDRIDSIAAPRYAGIVGGQWGLRSDRVRSFSKRSSIAGSDA